MLRTLLTACLAALLWLSAPDVRAQTLQDILQTHAGEVAKPGRRSVGEIIDDLIASGLPQAQTFLQRWADREVYQRDADGLFFYADESGADQLTLTDVDTGAETAGVPDSDYSQIRPNGGVRRVIGTALVQFQLSSPDLRTRRGAVNALARALRPEQIEPLEASIPSEENADLKARKERLLSFLKARFGETTEERVAAIEGLTGDTNIETRAVLNQLLTTGGAAIGPFPEEAVLARSLTPGDEDLSVDAAYALMVEAGRAEPVPGPAARKAVLIRNIQGGTVGGVPIAQLDDQAARDRAYLALVESGAVQPTPWVPGFDKAEAVADEDFALLYDETDADVVAAANRTLNAIESRVALAGFLDLTLDALSLASIYFLAAIGLAITFGVMGVINMAHGEFIMMGAYTGYVVQQLIPNYTASIIVALPMAFIVGFGAGVAMERLVIRWLYHRPLETLLATFGISIALQQLAKNIFGTQARPLTSPGWLDGALVFNDVVAISYIRIAIFVLALVFLGVFLFIMRRTRLGLETRAVTQNRRMAASMGINPDKVNMLTFGLGSGIAGIAGVAIGLYAKVTSEMGSDYIVQSFMTVVVGGVGNIWGTLLGAAMIGFLQKGIEWFNPSNTLAAQTYMIIFIILFIQFRPRGIIALKGRAAGD